MLTRLAPRDALRTEADVKAVLMSMGSVTRPGPRVNLAPAVLGTVIEALRGPFRLYYAMELDHLYQWRDKIEVIAPEGLRELRHATFLRLSQGAGQMHELTGPHHAST